MLLLVIWGLLLLPYKLQPITLTLTNNTYTPPSGDATEASSKQVDLSGLKIYSIDADVITETNAGVTKDGLYVFKGSDTAGWDAYRLGGNAQQGWNVVEKVAGCVFSSKQLLKRRRLVNLPLV